MNYKKLKLWLAAGVMALSLVPSTLAMADSAVYEGTAEGRNGEIKVSVTVGEDGAIEDIQVEAEETPGVGDVAIEQLTSEILENQSIAVDGIAGASISSSGFLAAVEAALTAGGLNAEDYKGAVEAKQGEDQTIDTEIVIIGAGGAGMAAAASASDAGAQVVVLEKMSAIGGNTRVGEGTYNVADPELLEATGTKTTPDLEKEVEDAISVETDDEAYLALLADVTADFEAWKESNTDTLFDSASWHTLQTYLGGGEIGDLDLIRTYAEGAVDTFDWLTDDIGVQFKDDYIFMAIGGKWTRGHQIDMTAATGAEGDNGGNVYITKLKERTDANGVEIYTEANVKKILLDENGRACGAVAERSDGSTLTVNASKGVILATGGFAANAEMVYEYSNGTITTPLTSCAVSSTGDGIGLAEEVGASMTDLDQIQVHPLGDPIDDCGCVSEFVGNWLGAQYYMFVNKEGERFVKEDGTRYEMSMAELEQTDAQMWLIVDSSQIAGDDSRTAQIESLIADGHTVKGETLEELAEQIGVDAQVLQATVDKYNAGMENGEDEFGKATDPNATISVGPFYASLRTPTVHHTMGGVTINSDTEVIDTEGNVIPGLYAAGEVVGGIHGNNRLGGNAFSDIMTFGRIAGEKAAAE
jgi:flavocytochrome c